MPGARAVGPARMSRGRRVLLALLLVLAVLGLASIWLSRPGRVPALLLDRIGAALGLEVSASGSTQYRLRGTPMLLLRNVVAREPGAPTPLLRAGRVYLSLPWSTIRARGDDLTIRRIELDDAQLDLPALRRWLATRPPSADTRIPTLTDGLRITRGSVVDRNADGGWRIDGIRAELPSLHPDRALRTRLRGRYLDPPLAVGFDLAIALHTPATLVAEDVTGFGGNGRITIDRDDWHLPAHLALSGPLQWDQRGLRMTPARLGLSARYESGATRLPFALGLHGPLGFERSTWTLAPAGVALRGPGPVPVVDAHGSLALGRHLALQLDGAIAQWPDSWPTLPAPIGQSSSPLPFALRYVGAADLSDVASVHLRRDAATFNARLRLPTVMDWVEREATSPLPPLDGLLLTPTLEISGALLEGVEVEFDDGDIAAP